jgi:protein gp37
MSRDLIVAKLGGALALLAQARDATDAKHVADLARAVEVYAKRQRLSEDAIAYATAVKVDAMTLMGEFLKAAPKNTGAKGQLKGRDASGSTRKEPPENGAPTQEALFGKGGKKVASVAQALADMKQEDPALHEEVRGGKVTPTRAANRHRRTKARARAGLPLPVVNGDASPYVILADWQRTGAAERARLLAVDGAAKFNPQEDAEGIRWARWSWNPVTGCDHGCPYCYARDQANLHYDQGFVPSLWPDRLAAPENTPFPRDRIARAEADGSPAGQVEAMGLRNVFVCSMADLFGPWVPDEWIEEVLRRARAAPSWNFLFLTKSPQRLPGIDFPDNSWVGTTVDRQARVAPAERAFAEVKAKVKWLSVEPMLEPLRFDNLARFDWVVIGGASTSSQTPEWHPPRAWVLALEDECRRLGVPFFEKANLRGGAPLQGYPGDPPPAEQDTAPESLRY